MNFHFAEVKFCKHYLKINDRLIYDIVCVGNIEMATFLIQNGADVNAVDKFGRTPLHSATESRQSISICVSSTQC